MGRYFFDTSALIKLYHQEKGTEDLDKLVLENQPNTIIISDLSVIEMVSAFAKKVRTQAISTTAFARALTAFERDLLAFERVEINQIVQAKAIELLKQYALEQGLRSLDSLQIASALIVQERQALDLFIAGDKTLLEVASQERLPVLLA